MFDPNPAFRPVHRRDGYLPLEDLGLIGDGETAALVGIDGSIPWLCLPRLDSEPVFCGLLDHAHGGHFIVGPTDLQAARQRYEPDTAVLITEMTCATGVVRVTDAFALRPGADLTDHTAADRAELIRSATVLDGHVELVVDVQPRGGASRRAAAGGVQILMPRRPDLALHLRSSGPLDGLRTTHHLAAGDRLDLVLSWAGPHRHHRFNTDDMLSATVDAWRRWMTGFTYQGPEQPLVRRAAITLKLCDHWDHGSLVAAPTASLPAPIGGIRNWTIGIRGSGTRRTRSTRCGASASAGRPTHSSAGSSTRSKTAHNPASCTRSAGARYPTNGKTPNLKATAGPPRFGGVTAQPTSASTTYTAK